MSHGPSSDSGITAEPNLTPMLDMVLQVLMFFIICADFKNRATNVDMELPESQSAAVKEDMEESFLFVSVKPFKPEEYRDALSPAEYEKTLLDFKDTPGASCVLTIGKPPRKVAEIRYDLKDAYDDAKLKAPDGKVNMTVVIRADKNTQFAELYRVMTIVKQVGFTKLKVSAMTRREG
jgi:biopolymer transport protein ExbD